MVEAAAVVPPGGGAVTGWAALAWVGGRWFTGRAASGELVPVQLAMWDDVRPQRGILVCHEGIVPTEVRTVDLVPVTDPVRTVFFLMRYARDLQEAVVVADMAAYDDLVSLDELAAYAAVHRGWTGSPQARKALALADENSWSPMEVRTRLVWEHDAELPGLLTNAPVFDRYGRHVATPDLLDVEAGLAIEYDGEVHLSGERRRADRARQEALHDVGIETLTVLAGDVADRDRLVTRMWRARARAPWQAPEQQRWTVTPPDHWTSTRTVAARRALTDVHRSRFLRYRRSA